MNDSTLIRRENLRALNLAPATLAARVGNSKQYWSDLLRDPKKSFGETIARKIEEKLELPRGVLDQVVTDEHEGEITSSAVGKVAENSAGCQPSPTVPTSMPYSAPNLKSAILLMGSLLGALDLRSKTIIGDMLKDLALHPDESEDIAEKASVLATVQKPITKDKNLNKALRGSRQAVETGHSPLER